MKNKVISIMVSAVMVMQVFCLFYKPKITVDMSKIFRDSPILGQFQEETTGDGPYAQGQSPSLDSARDSLRSSGTVPFISAEDLKLELLGTALCNVKDPVAFIKDLSTGKQSIYRRGNSVKGFILAKITMGEVSLERNGKTEILKMSDRAIAWSNIEQDTTPIITTSGSQIVVNKTGALKQVAKIYNTLRGVKVVPHYQSNEVVGLMVDGVTAGSIIEEAGIRNKDIIQVVNNQKIDSYQKALEVFRKARNNSEVKVCLLRDGQSRTLMYHIDK